MIRNEPELDLDAELREAGGNGYTPTAQMIVYLIQRLQGAEAALRAIEGIPWSDSNVAANEARTIARARLKPAVTRALRPGLLEAVLGKGHRLERVAGADGSERDPDDQWQCHVCRRFFVSLQNVADSWPCREVPGPR